MLLSIQCPWFLPIEYNFSQRHKSNRFLLRANFGVIFLSKKLKLLIFGFFVFGMIAIALYLLIPIENDSDSQNNNSIVVIEKNKKLDNSIQIEKDDQVALDQTENPKQTQNKKGPSENTQVAKVNVNQNEIVVVKVAKDQKEKNIDKDNEIKQTEIVVTSNLSAKKSDLITDPISSVVEEKINLSVSFSEYNSKVQNKSISVSIPIKTHTGKFEEYNYSATLEREHFIIKWETPGWYHLQVNQIKEIQFTHNSVKVTDLKSLKHLNFIPLEKLLPIEFILETSDGLPVSDGTSIVMQNSDWLTFNLAPTVINQKGTLFLRPNEIIEIFPLLIGDYFSDKLIVDTKVTGPLSRKLILKRKIKFNVTFQDAEGKPLQNHFVYFTNKNNPLKQYSAVVDFRNKGTLDKSKYSFIYQTNQLGEIDAEVPAIGEYSAVIFGEVISKGFESKIKIAVDGDRIQVKINRSTAEVKLNFLENGIPYLKEVKGSYHTYANWEYFSSKEGFVVLKDLQEGYFQLELKNEGFINDRLILTIPLEGKIEKNIELKKGAFLSGTLMSDGAPIKNEEIRLYLYVKGDGSKEIKTDTDLNGHFRFEKLDPNITYVFFIDVKNYVADPSISKEYRSSENEISINLIKRHDLSGEVNGNDGKPVAEMKIDSFVSFNNKVINTGYIKIDTNKFNMTVQPGHTVFLAIKAKGFATQYQEFIFDPITHAEPLMIKLQNGFLVKGKVLDLENKPILAGYIVEAYYFERRIFFSNRMPTARDEKTPLGEGGSFLIENAVVGEKYLILSEGFLPIPFTIEEKHRNENIDLKVLPSFQVTGTLINSKDEPLKRIRIEAQKLNSKEMAGIITDENGAFQIKCMTPGKWKLVFQIRDKDNKRPTIEVEIIDKDVIINEMVSIKE